MTDVRVEEILGNEIKELRLKNGLSQVELAKKAGISRTYLSQIENGLRSPSFFIVTKIFRLLKIHKFDENGLCCCGYDAKKHSEMYP